MKTTKKTAQAAEKENTNGNPGSYDLDYTIDQDGKRTAEKSDGEEQADGLDEATIYADLQKKETNDAALFQELGLMVMSNEATIAMELINRKNQTIEEVKAESESVKAENQTLKAKIDKPISLSEAKAKSVQMNQTLTKLNKVEDLAKQLDEFELGREGQEATMELTNKAGQKFKTGNTYLFETVINALKKEIAAKTAELEEELKKLY